MTRHEIRETTIVSHTDVRESYSYPYGEEESGGQIREDFSIMTESPLSTRIEDLRVYYEKQGYYDTYSNHYFVTRVSDFSMVSLWDLAWSEADRAHIPGGSHHPLVRTDTRRRLQSAYNQGIIQLISLSGLDEAEIFAAIQKIHTDESIAPFLLAQGLYYQKKKIQPFLREQRVSL